jgi:SOS response regulatory protein OraA/RecX
MAPDDTRLLQYAVRLLARKGYPEKALRERLLRRSPDPAAVEKVIDKLKGLNYLNDFHWAGLCARAWAAERHWGPHRIRHELAARGVDAAVAEAALAGALAEHPEPDILESAVARWLRVSGPPRSLQDLKRLESFLARRGFTFERIRERLAEIHLPAEDDTYDR